MAGIVASSFSWMRRTSSGSFEIGVGQLAHFLGHRRRQEQGLAAFGDGPEDLLDGRAEPDVEHLVGLVEDDDLDLVEADRVASHQVHQAAGGGDHHLATLAQHSLLADDRLAPNDSHGEGPAAEAETLELAADLGDQLAGRGEDQGARASLAFVELLEDRQQEGGCLAGSGRRVAQAITSGQGGGDEAGPGWGSGS